MKRNIFTAALALCLAACGTQKQATNPLPLYDTRPSNVVPTIERPAWPNYDTQNENSFAVFSNVLTVPKQQGHFLVGTSGDAFSATWRLYRCSDATYVTYDYPVPQDWMFWRFTTGSCIIDADTGDRYLLRELEHLPMDQCFWVHGMTGKTIRFIQVYAPLPTTVKHIQFYEAAAESRQWMNGDASLSKVYDVDVLRRDMFTASQGRIIR